MTKSSSVTKSSSSTQVTTRLNRLLTHIEVAGNRLPHPALLFVYLSGVVLLLSWLLHNLGVSAIHPSNGTVLVVDNLLSAHGLQRIVENTVSNFIQFAPVGTVLVAIMGIGVAEHSGLLSAVLRATVIKASPRLLTFTVVLAGVLSSLASDIGYVVLLPLAALMFKAVGRHPVAGIAAAFAGVSGGYSANIMIGPLDAILGGISTAAAQLVDTNYQVSPAANYYFMCASTLLISVVGAWVTERWVEPRFSVVDSSADGVSALQPAEKRGLQWVGLFSLVFIGLLLWGLLPEAGVLRDPQTGSVLSSPFMRGIVTLVAAYAAIAGIIYGKVVGSLQRNNDIVLGMEKSMATIASYLVLMFFAAQFVSYFNWSQIGIIAAIKGAGLLQQWQLSTSALLIMFVVLAALINLLVGSASAKWALIAPVFVPMLMLVGITPEATQVAFRIGDSSTNIITPLMPYFGVVMAFVQQYDKKAGVGTVIAAMLPYSVMFLVCWSLLLVLWIVAGLPLGPGAEVLLH